MLNWIHWHQDSLSVSLSNLISCHFVLQALPFSPQTYSEISYMGYFLSLCITPHVVLSACTHFFFTWWIHISPVISPLVSPPENQTGLGAFPWGSHPLSLSYSCILLYNCSFIIIVSLWDPWRRGYIFDSGNSDKGLGHYLLKRWENWGKSKQIKWIKKKGEEEEGRYYDYGSFSPLGAQRLALGD